MSDMLIAVGLMGIACLISFGLGFWFAMWGYENERTRR